MRRVILAFSLVLPALGVGCGNDAATVTSATPTSVTTVTDTFTGTLNRNGATSHPFPIAAAAGGEVTATLKSISPESTSVVGLSLGEWNGSACATKISNDRAIVSSAILGRATTTGTLCVRIFDSGSLTQSQDYELEVIHP